MGRLLTILGAFVALLVAIVAIILVRTFNYGDETGGDMFALPEPPAIDITQAADHLGQAMRIKTITTRAGDPLPGREGPWLELREFIETTYTDFIDATSREIVGGYTLLYTWEGRDPSLDPMILMAHQDVVPINLATIDDWTHGPHAGITADGHVWGRGAMDNKGSLIMILEAANALARDGWQPTRTVIFLFGHDEEVSGQGAQAAFAHLKSKNVVPAMVLDEGMVVLEEHPLTGQPAAAIGIAEKGYLSLVMTASTIGGHSSTPPRESGAVRIARAITALEDNQMEAHLDSVPIREGMKAVGRDLPFPVRMAFANTWAFGGVIKGQAESDTMLNALLRTTTAPTMMSGSIKDNILPQQAYAVVNFRVHPNNSTEDVIEHVRSVTSHIEGLTVDRYGDSLGSEPSPVSSMESKAWQVLEAVASATGDGAPVMPMLVLAATDSRYATAIADDHIFKFAPAQYPSEDLAGIHGTDERISLVNLEKMGRGYAQIMMAMAGEG